MRCYGAGDADAAERRARRDIFELRPMPEKGSIAIHELDLATNVMLPEPVRLVPI